MKIGHIILIIVAIIAVIAGVVVFTNSNNEEVNVAVENEQILAKIQNQLMFNQCKNLQH